MSLCLSPGYVRIGPWAGVLVHSTISASLPVIGDFSTPASPNGFFVHIRYWPEAALAKKSYLVSFKESVTRGFLPSCMTLIYGAA